MAVIIIRVRQWRKCTLATRSQNCVDLFGLSQNVSASGGDVQLRRARMWRTRCNNIITGERASVLGREEILQ